jgi:Ca-activated chloride channel family protein
MRASAWAAAAALVSVLAQERAPLFRSAVEIVRLDISAMRDTEPIRGLTAQDFAVTDKGVPQQIESVTLEQLPISVLLVLDTSGSMAGAKLEHLAGAAHALVAALRPADRAAIVGFSHRIQITAGLTPDRDRLTAAIDALRADGATSLRDALFASLQLTPVDESRPLVLLFSDGEDNASWLTEGEALEAVQRAAVTVDAIDIPATHGPALTNWHARIGDSFAPGRRFLQRVADAGGGRAWSGTSSRDLRALFVTALDEMRARYVLSFYPSGVDRDGWHEVTVKLRGPGEVRTRPGYYVAPQAVKRQGPAA